MNRALKIPRSKRTWTDTELAAWAADHPVGTLVRYWSVRGEPEHVDARICSEPWRLGHGFPIVKIEGISGGVALDHLAKLPQPLPQILADMRTPDFTGYVPEEG